MNVLTIYAHPNPKSFCHAVLERFTKGLADAGHSNEVVDLYAIGFDPRLEGGGLLNGNPPLGHFRPSSQILPSL